MVLGVRVESLHCCDFGCGVHGPLNDKPSPNSKIGLFTPITFDSPGLKTNISYRNFGAIFSDYGPLIAQCGIL